jgi:hypothetical protein
MTPTATTEPPWQLRHFEANLLAMERYPSILASSLTSKRKALNKNVPYEKRGPFYGALRTFAIKHRLTWNGERYVEALSDRELEDYLLGETNWPSLNHFISTRYSVACMSKQHRSRLWCRAKQLGADWDKGEKRFKARENQ